jgi:hypothetical protein
MGPGKLRISIYDFEFGTAKVDNFYDFCKLLFNAVSNGTQPGKDLKS